MVTTPSQERLFVVTPAKNNKVHLQCKKDRFSKSPTSTSQRRNSSKTPKGTKLTSSKNEEKFTF